MTMQPWQTPRSLRLLPRTINHLARESERDFNYFEREMFPYWSEVDHLALNAANETQQVVNDDKKFVISLDVSHFRPEDLDVHLKGRELTIEGHHEHMTENSSINRSFVRKWILPENVDLDAIKTLLTHKGHLCVEAPKVIDSGSKRRNIPINKSKNHE